MRKLFRLGLSLVLFFGVATPISGDNCYECFDGDLCIPVPLGWGYDTCRERVRRYPCDIQQSSPIYCIYAYCDLGNRCYFAWDPA